MRLPRLTSDQYSPRQKELADRIGGKRGNVGGPFACWLYSPELCDRVEALASYVRFENSLSEKLREFCLLICARYWGAEDSWNAHVAKAIAAGLSADVILALAQCRAPKFEAEDEKVFYQLCKELLEMQFVSDATFTAAQKIFGNRGLVDIVGCLGTFTMMSFCLNAFQVDPDPAKRPPFADILNHERIGPRMPLG
jgi:4-carboxymuconolactone decarboxylase